MAQGPLVYAYVRTRLTGVDLRWQNEYIHPVPIGIFIFAEIMFLLSMETERLYGGINDWRLWFDNSVINLLGWAYRISALVYGVLAWRFMLQAEARLQNSYSNPLLAEPRWVKVLLIGFLGLWIWTSSISVVALFGQEPWLALWGWHSIILFLHLSAQYCHGCILTSSQNYLRRPRQSFLRRLAPATTIVCGRPAQSTTSPRRDVSGPRTHLAQLASAAEMTERQASELINTHLGKNFFELVNRAALRRLKFY